MSRDQAFSDLERLDSISNRSQSSYVNSSNTTMEKILDNFRSIHDNLSRVENYLLTLAVDAKDLARNRSENRSHFSYNDSVRSNQRITHQSISGITERNDPRIAGTRKLNARGVKENTFARESSEQQQNQKLIDLEQIEQLTVDSQNNSLSSTLQSLKIDEARKEANKVQIVNYERHSRGHHHPNVGTQEILSRLPNSKFPSIDLINESKIVKPVNAVVRSDDHIIYYQSNYDTIDFRASGKQMSGSVTGDAPVNLHKRVPTQVTPAKESSLGLSKVLPKHKLMSPAKVKPPLVLTSDENDRQAQTQSQTLSSPGLTPSTSASEEKKVKPRAPPSVQSLVQNGRIAPPSVQSLVQNGRITPPSLQALVQNELINYQPPPSTLVSEGNLSRPVRPPTPKSSSPSIGSVMLTPPTPSTDTTEKSALPFTSSETKSSRNEKQSTPQMPGQPLVMSPKPPPPKVGRPLPAALVTKLAALKNAESLSPKLDNQQGGESASFKAHPPKVQVIAKNNDARSVKSPDLITSVSVHGVPYNPLSGKGSPTPNQSSDTQVKKKTSPNKTRSDFNQNLSTGSGSNLLFQSYSLQRFLTDSKLRKGEKTILTKFEFEVPRLERPIGICVLSDGKVVVGVSGRDEVHVYDTKGKLVGKLHSNRQFRRPTDMINLLNGRFAVRDDGGVQVFGEDGVFVQSVGEGIINRCYGLATDGQGHLIAINVGGRNSKLTKPNETDVLFFKIETGQVSRRIELAEIIDDQSSSKCRFLACDGKRLFVVDLGLDRIYVVDMERTVVRTFGGSGRTPGLFGDPAGVAIDKSGNIIIADAKNNRLQIFDKHRNFLGLVQTSKPLHRPSGIAFDTNSAALFVLNLRSSSLTKYSLVPN